MSEGCRAYGSMNGERRRTTTAAFLCTGLAMWMAVCLQGASGAQTISWIIPAAEAMRLGLVNSEFSKIYLIHLKASRLLIVVFI